MTTFYTGKGDGGTSKLGEKILPKNHPIFELLGTLDELNSWTGFCRVVASEPVAQSLIRLQQGLFIAQAEAAAVGMAKTPQVFIQNQTPLLEQEIQRINEMMPDIRSFIIPGGAECAARLDVARTIARRVERAAATCAEILTLRPELLQYLNRLSSIYFALARLVNWQAQVREEKPSYQ